MRPKSAEGRYFWVDFPSSSVLHWIAIQGEWNAVPRKAHEEKPDKKVDTEGIRAILSQKGLGRYSVNVEEIVRVDLEGDGCDELLIRASGPDFDTYGYKPGQYSMVVLQKTIKGKTKTYLVAGDFYSKKRAKTELPAFYDIHGVWDLDGDGVMEVVLGFMTPSLECYGSEVHGLRKGKMVLLAKVRPNYDFKYGK